MTASCDTLLLSDLHLGSEVSRAADALDLLQSIDFRQLILLGDIFSDLNFNRLTGDHWRFVSEIRRLSNPRRRKKIVWVEGNHDMGLSNLMSHLTGIPVYERYVWEYQGLHHDSWTRAYNEPELPRSLLSHRLSQNQRLVPLADKTVVPLHPLALKLPASLMDTYVGEYRDISNVLAATI